ncbi:MAG: hypothetical protein KGY74_08760 [Candidatus Cloacimonetes bacterium]|nr:hypothetical protein [Candidatus Cloacimonadota bacterium]
MADIIKEFPEVYYVDSEDTCVIYCGEKEENMIGFYVPQRNQYLLHNNTTKISYVYDLKENKWTTFKGLDIEKESLLSGGDAKNNVNIILTDNNEIKQYPSNTNCSASAYVEKTIRVNYADFLSYDLTFTGSASAVIKIYNPKFQSASIKTSKNINNFTKNNLPLGFYGNKFKITIKDAEKIDNLLIKYSPRKSRQ